MRARSISVMFAFAVIAAMAVVFQCMVHGVDPKAAPYRFEPEPRALSAIAGLGATRFAKLADDGITANSLYVLVTEEAADRSRLIFLLSTDGGDTFASPVVVSGNVSSHGENSPALIGRPVIYGAWNEGSDLRFGRSRSWGADFDPAVHITDRRVEAFSGYVSIGVGPDGDVYAVWIDTRDGTAAASEYSIYLARSADHGESFAPNVRVATGVCPCCRPDITFGPEGEVLLFWRGVYAGNMRDMTTTVSRDHGATFSAPHRIAEDGWAIDGCPDSGLATARVGSRIYAAWLSEGAAAGSGIHLSWTEDAGTTWAPVVLASQRIRDANYPSMSAGDDGHVVLSFQGRHPERSAGWANTAPFIVEIDGAGRVSAPLGVPGVTAPVTRPTVLQGRGGRLFVAWTATIAGKQTVQLSRARRDTAS